MNIRNKLPEYFLEFLIIVFGISLSFIINEWRKDRDNQQAEIEALQAIHADLVVDSTTISKEAGVLKSYVDYYSYFLQNSLKKAANQDSIIQALGAFGNYTTFEIRNVNFQQLQATGQLKLISNKKVLTDIINIYANQYSHITEYIHIDRTLVLNQIMPYMMKESPVSFFKLYNSKDLLKSKDYKKLLKDSSFQNLFIVNLSFKSQSLSRYLELNKLVKNVLIQIEEELERLN